MRNTHSYSNEQQVSLAFSRQSVVFDDLYRYNSIVTYKRNRVREHLQRHVPAGRHILELNAGTGEDALYFARMGYKVHATDISVGMQQQLIQKVNTAGLNQMVSTELCSFTQLQDLQNKGPYDCIFSNFAGLNCTGELDKVLNSFNTLLKPGGVIVLVVLPKFCLWETLLIAKGKWKTATRRFFSKNGRIANVEGTPFTCWYYSPSFIYKQLQEKFDLLSIEGLCTLVPPSYIEHFAEKHPHTFSILSKAENNWKNKWPWNRVGDYFIISMRKKGTA